jgi:hypothetical protein
VKEDLTTGRKDAMMHVRNSRDEGGLMRSSNIDTVMKTAEHRQAHIARRERPHLAQEYEDRGATADADSITYYLTPHARMCAKGEVSPPKAFAL